MKNLYLKLFGSPRFYNFNNKINYLTQHAMGIGNPNVKVFSGEEHFLNAIVPKKSEKMRIFDVGAFYGDYSSMARKSFPDAELYAFEPNPKVYQHLLKNTKNLSLNTYNIGFGDQEENRELYYPIYHGENTPLGSLYPEVIEEVHFRTKTFQKVTIQTLDQFCEKHHISQIDLLKIDAEGFEYQILLGAQKLISSFCIDIIQFELNESIVIHRKLLRDFMDLLPFYKFFRLLPKGMVALNRSPGNEYIALQNIIAWREDLLIEKEFSKC